MAKSGGGQDHPAFAFRAADSSGTGDTGASLPCRQQPGHHREMFQSGAKHRQDHGSDHQGDGDQWRLGDIDLLARRLQHARQRADEQHREDRQEKSIGPGTMSRLATRVENCSDGEMIDPA